MSATAPIVRKLGRCGYTPIWEAMQAFVTDRGPQRSEEIWLLEHDPVFTLGQNGAPEHILAAGDIPVVKVDRGGQVTYHGPGQLVIYPLLHLPRRKLGVRCLVRALERSVIDLLAGYGCAAIARRDAPGVYVDGAKVASIGLRIRKDWCFHGMAINVAMDMEPFARINPCGFEGMAMTQLRELGGATTVTACLDDLLPHLLRHLGYNESPLIYETMSVASP